MRILDQRQRRFSLPPWIRLLRPAQWLKNGIVGAAYLFARWDPTQAANAMGWRAVASVALAVACFCAMSSAVYILNDWNDREADRRHPVKRLRPLASGEVSPGTAWGLFSVLFVVSIASAWFCLPIRFVYVLGGYAAMQIAYTFFLKRISYVDIFVISIGFVLRAVAGAVAITVRISPWLLLCTFLLSLFLALCKRRHEKILLEAEDADGHRAALSGYDQRLLDLQIGILAAATLVCYSIYTLAPETVNRFGTNRLGLTIPFVIFGIFRYLELVYRHAEGGRPEKVMLTDKIMIGTVLAYFLTALLIFLTLPR
ncbi:MAG: decaprenyl-phosphate phosphoribosyltransferase [Kiritimatiellae bacterium]|nr:decaprenyl-phosphate phosphoribosyltransferase [Kiritimatiellia bacterium]